PALPRPDRPALADRRRSGPAGADAARRGRLLRRRARRLRLHAAAESDLDALAAERAAARGPAARACARLVVAARRRPPRASAYRVAKRGADRDGARLVREQLQRGADRRGAGARLRARTAA